MGGHLRRTLIDPFGSHTKEMQTMKKSLLIIPLLAVGLSTGFGVQSAPAFNAGCENGPGVMKEGRSHRQERMAAVLGLSTEQQQQMTALREEGQAAMQPLREALAANREKVRALVNAESFEENAVRSLAAEEATTRTELLVVRTRMQQQIHALMTPEQRALAERLSPLMKGQGGHGEHHPIPHGERL
jgi:protein CpxP